ncbi:MAG: cytochrome c oxidase accessory protein CcoG [Herminiimonas sp.]|nr:cytochrome c oxidase accessory protein CcoG [Herminiimonas sp.]
MSSAGPDGTATVIKMYAARAEIYPREAKGRYASLRWACVWITQLVFYGLPWLQWNDRQAVLFDLGTRKFYLFGIVLWPQDFIYLAALLIIAAYALFLITAVAGRVWCGFACPQTVYTEIFLWIERRIEGTRSARMRLDRQPWSIGKLSRKTAKHAAWGLVALWTGLTFVGYFTPIKVLQEEIGAFALGPWETFWILFYAFATYGNAGWMREQVCKYMCPYARFQSAMFDHDTLIVTYDKTRGEPRGPQARNDSVAAMPAAMARLLAKADLSAPATAGARTTGDCIDCSMCVQVCPTGIDIRDGLQYECIGCAACVDACNSVMDKVGTPRGLVRYATENALQDNLSVAQIRRRALRPRVLIYCALLLAIVVAFFSALALRTPLKVDVIRDRGALGREIDGGAIENVYRLQIMNTAEVAHRFRINVAGIDSIAVGGSTEVSLSGADARAVPVSIRVAHGKGHPGSNPIVFTVEAVDDPRLRVKEPAVFFVPR